MFLECYRHFEFVTRDHVLNMDAATTGATVLSEERALSESGDVHVEEDGARSRVWPLNSKRLTAALLRRIANALSLPTDAPAEQLRQLIEGKLITMGKEPMNVQVLVTGAAETPALQDEGGVFLTAADSGMEEAIPVAGGGVPDLESHAEHVGDGGSQEELLSQLETVTRENHDLKDELATVQAEKAEVMGTLEEQMQRVTTLEASESTAAARIEELSGELVREKERVRHVWRLNCEQIAHYDAELVEREREIAALKNQLEVEKKRRMKSTEVELPASRETVPTIVTEHRHSPIPTVDTGTRGVSTNTTQRRGKAPPVDLFTGENTELRFDDWLPNLERASAWNGWTDEELLLQLAGHLRGRALLEWNLLDQEEKSSYQTATEALRSRLDPGGRALAAQDFRHTYQREHEPVGDFIRRLERTYQLAYGRDKMAPETRATLLHSQLQEGLRYRILQAPSVSGAQRYSELCLAAKNKEKRQAELHKREKYRREGTTPSGTSTRPSTYPPTQSAASRTPPTSVPTSATTPSQLRQSYSAPVDSRRPRRCYTCGSAEHLAKQCPQGKGESQGRRDGTGTGHIARTNVVQADRVEPVPSPLELGDPRDCLLSSGSESDGGDVKRIEVSDQGSHSQSVVVEIEGVPVRGVVDTGSDITIIGGHLFKHVATTARLRKRQFKPPDRLPRAYNHQPFRLDGRMDLRVSFGEKDMVTPIYVKMDAPDPLLLSEGVCRQLGIVCYASSQVFKRDHCNREYQTL